eukprot:478454-Prymnesium_polylepis.1
MVQPDSIVMDHPWLEKVFKALCLITAIASLFGPVVMGSVLINNCSACGASNFDLFIVASSDAFKFNEICTCVMCYGLCVSTAMLVW